MRHALVFACLSSFLVTTACVSRLPPTETWRTTTSRPFNNVAQILASQAVKCWTRTITWSKDPIRVDVDRSEATVEITARRVPPDIRFEPFVHIIVSRAGSSTSIAVKEGTYATDVLGVTDHVKGWMAGRLACEDLNN